MAERHLPSRVTPSARPTCHYGFESHFDSWRFTADPPPSNT